jgi:hypothetical protein
MKRRLLWSIKLAVIATFSVLFSMFALSGVSSALGDNTFSGVLTDSTGAPLQNIGVYLNADNGDSAYAITDANGSYSITAPPQAYKLVLSGNGNGPGNLTTLILRQDQSTVDLTSGNIIRDLQIPTATLHVTVEDTNGNPVSGAGVTSYIQQGNSVTHIYPGDPGTTISYIGTTSAISTAADGTVDLTSVVGAEYGTGINGTSNSYICASVLGGSHCLSSPLTVAGDTNVTITVPVSYTYSGILTGSDGLSIPNIGVYLTSTSGNFGYATTDVGGHYSISLPPDTYAIKISGNGNGPGNLTSLIINPTASTVDLTSDDVVQNLQIPTATLHVTVKDASGTVVPDATVTSYVQQGNSITHLYPGDPGSVIYNIGTQQAVSAGPNGTIDITSVVGATYGTGSYMNSVNYLCATFSGNIVCLPASLTVTGDMNITLQEVATTVAPTITSTASAQANAGAPFSYTITTTGDPVPTLTRTGALPAGVTFTNNGDGTATLAGYIAAGTSGTFPLTLTASNSVGTATQSFVLTITNTSVAPVFLSADNASVAFGAPFSFTIQTSGNPAASIKKNGHLPPGIKFDDNGDGTATLSGIAKGNSQGHTYVFTLNAKNSAGEVAQEFTLTIL